MSVMWFDQGADENEETPPAIVSFSRREARQARNGLRDAAALLWLLAKEPRNEGCAGEILEARNWVMVVSARLGEAMPAEARLKKR